MQIRDIEQLLKNPESKTLEFKQNLNSPMRIMNTIIAFANTAGGIIIVGVEDKKHQVCGISSPWQEEEKLTNLVSSHVLPQLVPDIEVIPWRNTYLLKIQIYPSSNRPHYLRKAGIEKGTYIRVGSTNRQVDSSMLAELHRYKNDDTFDKQLLPQLSIDEIDIEAIKQSFALIKKVNKKELLSMDLIGIQQQKKAPTVGGWIMPLKYVETTYIKEIVNYLGEACKNSAHFVNGVYGFPANLAVPTTLAGFHYVIGNEDIKQDLDLCSLVINAKCTGCRSTKYPHYA